MTRPTLAKLRERREAADAAAASAYAELLNRVLELAAAPGANVTTIALEAGIARATVYNELARRQEHRDTLEERPPVPPAPADDEPDEPKVLGGDPSRAGGRFTLIQTQVLGALEDLHGTAGGTNDYRPGDLAGVRVERIAARVNERRRRRVSDRYVRGILNELVDGFDPAPVERVPARRGRTNYRLTDAELARRDAPVVAA